MKKDFKIWLIVALATLASFAVVTVIHFVYTEENSTVNEVTINSHGWLPYLINKTTETQNQNHQVFDVSTNAFEPFITCDKGFAYATVNLDDHPELDNVLMDQLYEKNGTQVMIVNQTGLCK